VKGEAGSERLEEVREGGREGRGGAKGGKDKRVGGNQEKGQKAKG